MKAAEVSSATFTTTKWREGYQIDEVDAFLERAAGTLDDYERGRPVDLVVREGAAEPTALSAESVVRARFSQTRFRDGYDQDQVDDLLDKVIVALREHEAH